MLTEDPVVRGNPLIDGILRFSVERITAGIGREQLDAFYGVLDRFRQNIGTLSEQNHGGTSQSNDQAKAES